jgi:hypothetical protein
LDDVIVGASLLVVEVLTNSHQGSYFGKLTETKQTRNDIGWESGCWVETACGG